MKAFKAIKETGLTEPLEPDATYFVKEPGDSSFSLHVTSSEGVSIPLEATAKALKFEFVSSAEWHVNHNLNRYPKYNIIIDGQGWDTAVTYPDSNNMILHFKRARTGFVEVL